MWNLATSQIFFSIGVCMGIMTSYGSYNKVNKPIIMDSFIIAMTNSFISFVSGFAVFTVIGYLDHIKNPVSENVSSFGLAFIAYPTAATLMKGGNFWNLLLFLTLFTLGIDSSFSFIEACSTVISDTPWGKRISRMKISAVICIGCFILGIPFCMDAGIYILDVCDHYVTAYPMLFLGIIQCVGAGWAYEHEYVIE
jgi:SNF family Na+-dependent transporter